MLNTVYLLQIKICMIRLQEYIWSTEVEPKTGHKKIQILIFKTTSKLIFPKVPKQSIFGRIL